MEQIHVKFAYNKFCDQFDQAPPWSFEDFCSFFEAGRDSNIPYQDEHSGIHFHLLAVKAAEDEQILQTLLIIKNFFNTKISAHSLGGSFEIKQGFNNKIARRSKALQAIKFSDTEEEMWRKL